MIQNVVAVRFSLRILDWPSRAYGDEANRESWFAFRSRLFGESLLKSCMCQTVPPKRLYVMMDRDDVDLYGKYMDQTPDFLVPVFSNEGDHNAQVAADLQRADVSNIAMSRIDSDDFVSTTYFERVNRAISDARAKGIDFDYVIATHGYVTDIVYINEARNRKSPFVTLYREVYAGETIYSFDHGRIDETRAVSCASANWMQIAHGGNISNRIARREDSRSVDSFWPDDFHRPDLDAEALKMRGCDTRR